MTKPAAAEAGIARGERRMRLRYGLNQADEWRPFAVGPRRDAIRARFRELGTRIIRIFVYDKRAPDPLDEWPLIVDHLEAVLGVGATPMITFAKFQRPFGDPRAVRWFAERCADVTW